MLTGTDLLVLGDFNAHHSLWHSETTDTRGTQLADSVNISSFAVLNTDSPSRLRVNADPSSPYVLLASNPPCLVNFNQVAHHLLVNGQGTMPTKPKCPTLPTVEGKPSLVSAFSEEEYRKGITALKNNRAAGIDDILVE